MDEIVKYYNKIAKIYDNDRFDNTYGKFIDIQERNVLNKLLNGKDEVVLDLACGSGRFMDYANYGVDASAEMVKIAQQKFPEKKIFLSDATEIDAENKSIDTIISFHFFMHLNEEKVKSILLECERILKDEGRIVFDLPSLKRRKLINYKSDNWHGSFSLTKEMINKLNPNFEVMSFYGILFIPIQRIPTRFRHLFVRLDSILCNSFLKQYCSYLIFELVKK